MSLSNPRSECGVEAIAPVPLPLAAVNFLAYLRSGQTRVDLYGHPQNYAERHLQESGHPLRKGCCT